ncbi:MAG TPA: sulfite exporter TauE/SafE family protein [Gammaproteobacteria bacterium]|nr:sulfite exporter TauE/SafE family protein [Gammaproteobacteria bacterium]
MYSYYQELLLLVAGMMAGYINVMAGGGSLLTVPAMVFMGIPDAVANGTNRIAILAQTLASMWVFFRKGIAELKLSLTLALFTLPGAVAGAWYGTQLRGVWFNRVLAGVMLAVLVLMHLKPSAGAAAASKPVTTTRTRYWLTHLLMIGVGFYGGLIQVGIGFIIIPILHRVMGLDMLRVNLHKVFLILPFTLLSLVIFIAKVGVVWTAGLTLALGNAAGGWLATHMMIQKGDKIIYMVFNIALFAMIIKLLLFN